MRRIDRREGAPAKRGDTVIYLVEDEGVVDTCDAAGVVDAVDEGVSAAVAAAAPADVVLVAPGSEPDDEAIARLREAAHSEASVATASALTAATIGSVGSTGEDAATALASSSLRLRPKLDAPLGPCVLIRRSALELAGPLDSGFFGRCVQYGLSHVLADDVLVSGDRPLRGLERTQSPVLSRALATARRALHGLTVTIDARVLNRPLTGMQRYVIELVGALAQSGEAQVNVLLPERPDPEAMSCLSRVSGLTRFRLGEEHPPADVVHRPFQVSTPADLAVLSGLADRIVLTHHDLISYHNPSYFRAEEAWSRYRELTRAALAIADRVVFDSAHAREEALAEELVEGARASVVHAGVDHRLAGAERSVAPTALSALAPERQLMVCLGADFRHKNRVFALQLLEQLHDRRGWDGTLVFAGPHVDVGSSEVEEQHFLSTHPHIADRLISVGTVSEAGRSWLLERAALVLYPTVCEGFGLVPFEAAAHGTPCLWAAGSSLGEVLPESAAGIVPWDAPAAAARAHQLMTDATAAAANIDAIGRAASKLAWREAAAQLLEIYKQACEEPASPAGLRERGTGIMRDGLSEDAMRLLGPDGVIPRELERPLLALSTRRRLAAPVFAALKAGYRLSQARGRR